MKNYFIFVLLAALTGIAAPVFANPMKIAILHCDCVYEEGEGASMEYVEIEISRKSRGHDEHVHGTVESCYDGTSEATEPRHKDVYTDFIRMGDDCQLTGKSTLRESIGFCEWIDEIERPKAGDLCGDVPWF